MQTKKLTKADVLKKICAKMKENIEIFNSKIQRKEGTNTRGSVNGAINNPSLVMECVMWAVNRKFSKNKFYDTRTFLAKKFNKSLPTIDSLLDKLRNIGFKIEKGLHKFSNQIIGCMKFEFPNEILELFELCSKGEMPPLVATESNAKPQQKTFNSLVDNLVSTFENRKK